MQVQLPDIPDLSKPADVRAALAEYAPELVPRISTQDRLTIYALPVLASVYGGVWTTYALFGVAHLQRPITFLVLAGFAGVGAGRSTRATLGSMTVMS